MCVYRIVQKKWPVVVSSMKLNIESWKENRFNYYRKNCGIKWEYMKKKLMINIDVMEKDETKAMDILR